MAEVVCHRFRDGVQGRIAMAARGSADRFPFWSGVGLGVLALLLTAFGVIVVIRGAYLKESITDLQVFLRAAWAVRNDADLYKVTDCKRQHYHYPPLLAIALMPLADAPHGAVNDESMPFAAKVAIWYVFSVFVLAWGIHALASALEDNSRSLRSRSRPGNRWWLALRLCPFLSCLPMIGQSLSMGQVNTLWLAFTCAAAVAILRKRRFQAGIWLAAAVCLKVLPVFLLVYPIWRRDVRCIAGSALGLLLGLIVIPELVLGPERTLAYGQEWVNVVLLPGFGLGTDRSRAEELLEVTATHNQAVTAVLHKTLYLDCHPRPKQIATQERVVGLVIGGGLALITLLVALKKAANSGLADVLFLGVLNVNMLLLAPAGHSHYLLLLLPLMMGLVVYEWDENASLWAGKAGWLLFGNLIVSLLPLVPGWNILFDLGVPMYGALAFWLVGVVALARLKPKTEEAGVTEEIIVPEQSCLTFALEQQPA